MCANKVYNSEGQYVKDCECDVYTVPDTNLPLTDTTHIPQNGLSCRKIGSEFRNDIRIYSAEPIGNVLIDKSLLTLECDDFFYYSFDLMGWQKFTGSQGIKMYLYNYPKYEFNTINADIYFKNLIIDFIEGYQKDSVHVDLRSLPNNMGYTDDGKGIFISFTLEESQYVKNISINLIEAYDTTFTPIRSIPLSKNPYGHSGQCEVE